VFAIPTGRDQLEALYRQVPGPFPALYERLVLSYRWLEVHLETAMPLGNPPGPTLDGLASAILGDAVLINTLLPARLIPFGRVSGGGYDPMCFDLRARMRDDCPIIQVEHESVLCHDRIGETWLRYPSFRELVCETVDRGKPVKSRKAQPALLVPLPLIVRCHAVPCPRASVGMRDSHRKTCPRLAVGDGTHYCQIAIGGPISSAFVDKSIVSGPPVSLHSECVRTGFRLLLNPHCPNTLTPV
jgi:hypothetical protein